MLSIENEDFFRMICYWSWVYFMSVYFHCLYKQLPNDVILLIKIYTNKNVTEAN